MRFDGPIFSLATRGAGSLVASHAASRFGTDVSIDGEEGEYFCFTTSLHGDVTLVKGAESVTARGPLGLAFRPGCQTRILTGDRSARTNVFIKVCEVEAALEHMLDSRLRKPLEFSPTLDWNNGLAASLKYQLEFVLREFERADGVADNAVALATTTDFLVALALRSVRHNYTDHLERDGSGATPAYVRRAEEFMRAHCAEPIRIVNVAAAAGCSVRTLGNLFRHFRGITPLEALHRIRLEHAHAELRLGANAGNGVGVATVARRYGFTNASRFVVAYRRRFGETPSDTARRIVRP